VNSNALITLYISFWAEMMLVLLLLS